MLLRVNQVAPLLDDSKTAQLQLCAWQVRPTSETIVNHMFTQWIQSYRDLPLMVNQVKSKFKSCLICFELNNVF